LDITEGMRIGITNSNCTYRTYSRSNRILDISTSVCKIYLYDLQGCSIIPLKKNDSENNSGKELNELNKKLGLTVMMQ